MGAPFYAEYAKLFNGPVSDYDDVAKQIRLIDEHTYDPETGLFYHGWDEGKDAALGESGHRLLLQFLGPRHRLVCDGAGGRAGLFSDEPSGAAGKSSPRFRNCAAGVVKWQDPKTGLWWQVMDQGGRKGNYLEATASSMFVYALAKGVNHGYLPRDYVPAIEKGYRRNH